ncbi:cell envelope biogenesis protein OmpA [Thioalkalivibrio denitrificans]|uniref:Cell envelope biogenesis protein OmpA n=1 Tax=Thioalkalivibrio denitrificans TaxID=108003 RepID=A0A1V3NSL2_9GAMM|nr:OmpA family protein [Thioalkalivibrio denitrificans]OOG28077.1 cell envelope biogenesis protein OmpA [Thioalkalivibrio denitrificans]
MKKLLVTLFVAGVVVFTGCTTTDPYTGEQRTARATQGALIGAAAGAVIGNVTGRRDRTKRAMIGAGIGALAGAAVGNYMDQQEAELRQQLEGTGVSVTRDGDNLILNMPGHVTFDVNRDEVKSEFYEVLNSVAIVLKKYDKTAVEVAGHTDSTGTVEHNMGLSQRRADSVARYLAGQGIQPVRIDTIGFGPHRPIADNSTVEGRALNRRVELTLIPLT